MIAPDFPRDDDDCPAIDPPIDPHDFFASLDAGPDPEPPPARSSRVALVASGDVAPTPPHDLDAEAAVISAALLAPARLAEVEFLRPDHFFSEAHRQIWSVIVDLCAAGEPVDPLLVQTRLRDRGRLQQVGGSGYLASILDSTPAPANIGRHGRIVLDKARLRSAQLFAERLRYAASGGVSDVDVFLREAVAQLGAVAAPRDDAAPLPTIGASEIFEPLPPRVWVCDRLRISGGGRPTLVVGPPGGGKTLALQSLALSVASGRKWLGLHAVTRARVLHLDGEVGAYLSRERYARQARALGIDPVDVDGWLQLANFPSFALDISDAEAVLAATCRGFDLVVLDSLTAFAGDADEHTPEIGKLLLKLARVAASTGVAFVVLHHTRRDGETRGSTSIYGGAENIWRMLDVDRGRATFRHERSPMGDLQLDLTFGISDIEVGGEQRAGLLLRELQPEAHAAAPGADHEALVRDVRAYLQANGPVPGGADVLAARLGRRAAAVRAALRELEANGEVTRIGSGPRTQLVLGGSR